MFDQTARSCLRLIMTRSLKASQYRALSKWMFGCQYQRNRIRVRVTKRGMSELNKALRFIERASEVLRQYAEEREG